MNHSPVPRRTIFPLLVSVVVLGLSILACGVSASTDNPSALEPTLPVSSVNPTAISVTAQPALPERRFLTLEFPPKIRVGDSDIIRLTLEVDDFGNLTPTAEVDGNVITGEVIEIPNLYQSHHVIAEARFDIAGMEVRPTELISAPIAQGHSAVFYWSVHPGEAGVYRGTIWLYLRFVDKSNGEESQKTVSAQIVEIEAVNLLGLSANLVRATGVIGSIIGTVLGFPFFEDIVRFLVNMRKKPDKINI